MGNYENLKQSITEVIRTNGNQEITGAVLQSTLLTIISTVGANSTFVGIATPTTNPGTPDGPVFYLASESGTYTNFNAIELQDGLSVLMWNGSWRSQQIFGVDDVPTAGSDNLVKSGGVEKFTSHGWKQGYIKNDGGIGDGSDNSIYNTYYFPVVKDRKYNLSSQTDLLWSISLYDTNKVFIQSVNWFTAISNYIATQDGFIRISLRKLDSSTFNSNEWIAFNPMVTESIPNSSQLTIGARYANTFDTISNSTNRLTVKELLRMPVGSRIQCTLASSYSLNMIQKESIESENYVDSGWIDKRIIEFDVVYPYQSINIRKNDDSNFSDRNIINMFHVDILNDSILGTVHSAPEVDDEPTAGSKNPVESGGVEKFTSHGWKQGYIKNDGGIDDGSNNSIYNTYYFPVVKDRKYNLSSQTGLLWSISLYNSNKVFIQSVNWFTEISNYIATQDGFIRLSLRKLDSSAFNSNEWIAFNPMVTESIPNYSQLTIGARYANTFDTIANSTNRLTVKELLRMPVGSRIQCTLASSYSLNMIQKESIESENYVDSGWVDKRIIEFDVVYPYQSINIRKNDDSNFSDRNIINMFHVDILNDSILGTVHSAPEKVNMNRLFTDKHIIVRHQVNSAEMTYQAALEGYKFIENDVRMSSDGVFVLCHNNTVKYNGEDVNVENLTWEQLKSVGVGNFIDQLNICSQFGLYLFAEWKPVTFTNSVIDDFVGLLVNYLGYNNFTLNKFYGEGQAYFDYVRRKDKNITLCYTTFRGSARPDLIKVIKNDGNAVLSFDYGATFDRNDKYGLGAYYEQAKELGITVGFWTTPTIDSMRAMTLPETGFIVTNSYILDNAQIIDKQYRSNYVFAQDELLAHNGTVENGKLHLLDGQAVTIPIQQTTGTLVVDFMIDGDFEITTVDNGEGQDITEYPTGILHPDGNHFGSGTYRYGIELRGNRTGNFVITADGDAYISVINITQSFC